jgi:thiamine biosynthesis lipoprotein
MTPRPIGEKICWALLLALTLGGCKPQEPAYTTRFNAFGTRIDLTVIGVDRENFDQVSAAIQDDFAFMHSAWQAWEPGPLGRVNQLLASGEEFPVPPSVYPLIQHGQILAARSGDLFNPAIGRLIDAWGFNTSDPRQHKVPDPEVLARLVAANPRMSDLTLNGILLRSSNPAVKLDFAGFGKGYGIDLAIDHLRELGVNNAIINAGGDLRAIGSRDGHPWRIPIRRPSGSGVFATIRVKGDESVFTTGSYERNFVFEGKTYHHIIDPRTGYPASEVRSVTVVHKDAITADAAATALFIAGPEHWQEVAQAMGIEYVLLVDNSGVLHVNPEMQERIELMDQTVQIRTSLPLRQRAGATTAAQRQASDPAPANH